MRKGCIQNFLPMLDTNLLMRQWMYIIVEYIFDGMVDFDPSSYLEEVTQGLAKSLLFAATNAFLHTKVDIAPLMVEPHKIVGK